MRNGGISARIVALLALFCVLLAACGGSNTGSSGGGSSTTPTAQTPISVALVTDIGGLNDRSFNHLAYVGYTKAMNEFHFTRQVIESKNQADYVKNLTLAARSADLVFAVGFLMQNAVDQVAHQFPTKKFAIIDGCAVPAGKQDCESLPNVAPLFFKEQEAGCLVGAIAAQMEVDGKAKISQLRGHNTIGAVGGLPIPPVTRYIAGYKFCAKKVDPSITVVINYSQDFAATDKCKDAALSQINQHNADIIFQVAGGCGVGALDAADQAGVFGIGVDADQNYLHPKSVITSALKKVDVAVYDTISDYAHGKFTNNPPRFDLAHDGVGYGTLSSVVPADAKNKADQLADQIRAGTLAVPENIPS
ncbi:BMP family lipoprotein [Thermogemmatispora onikobensis]|uniref:BMP family lipoprotein n=1 Tax=Thermogemmatispora onikobensis TaxID=732234 RepID=UPI0009FF694F|nr:BMP family ABC transporter substrate-binding protein [Thermogemmatispora onikobensis]